MKINISFLEGSGDSTETVNVEDSDGTTIPKLTLNLGGGKTESFGDEEENVSTEKYPDPDEAKDAGNEEGKEASGTEDASPTEGQDVEEEEETRAPVTENEENQDLSSIKPDQGFSEIGIWDEKGGEGGTDGADARQIEIDNIMEKLKEVYDMIHSVINKWSNSEEPPSSQTPAQYTEVTTELGNGNGEGGGLLSDTSPAPTEYNEDQDVEETGKKRRRRQKKKRRHRRIRRIRRRQ